MKHIYTRVFCDIPPPVLESNVEVLENFDYKCKVNTHSGKHLALIITLKKSTASLCKIESRWHHNMRKKTGSSLYRKYVSLYFFKDFDFETAKKYVMDNHFNQDKATPFSLPIKIDTQWQNLDPSTLLVAYGNADKDDDKWRDELYGHWPLLPDKDEHGELVKVLGMDELKKKQVLIASTPNNSPNVFLDLALGQDKSAVWSFNVVDGKVVDGVEFQSPVKEQLPTLDDFKYQFLADHKNLDVLFDIAKSHFEALLDFEKEVDLKNWKGRELMRSFVERENESDLFNIALEKAKDADITGDLLVAGLKTYRQLFNIGRSTMNYYRTMTYY